MKKISADTNAYLKGVKFSNSLSVKHADAENSILYRIDLLKMLCKDKQVVHLGFTDHIPLIQSKLLNKNWLHKELLDVTSRCLGIDINQEAVEYVKNVIGIKDVFIHDIVNDEKLTELTSQKWDYLLIGEVLEHIDNPVFFLKSIREKYAGCFSKLIITVPNAFEITNLKGVFKHKEFINSDHRFWFTPYTLAKVANSAGYAVDSYCYCQSYRPQSIINRFLLKKFPMLREGIVMIIENEVQP